MAEQNNNREARKRRARNIEKKRRRVIRNRIIALVCAIAIVVTAIVLLICKLAGVFDKSVDVSTLTLTKEGKVVLSEVSDFDEKYYDKASLKKFLTETVEKYNDANGKDSVSLDTVKVKKKVAYVTTTYKSVKDYKKFTGINAVSGKVSELKEKYAFKTPFVTVKKGVKGVSADKVDVTSQDKLKVLIVKENIRVNVPGKIVYVSDAATQMVDESTVDIIQPDGNVDATQATYIIYK